AIAAGVLYEVLQTLGGYYVGHTLKHASNVYGAVGLVIGLLSWIYLSAHSTLLAAEGNVVATRRLWPRSFSLMIEQPPTQADIRASRSATRSRSAAKAKRSASTSQLPSRPTRPGATPLRATPKRPSASPRGAKLAVPTRTDASEEATRMAYHQDI